jgi:hypothetical protein
VKYRDVEYDIEEVQPGRWRWKIYAKSEPGLNVVGEPKHRTREKAVEACIEEINNAFERGRHAPRRFKAT